MLKVVGDRAIINVDKDPTQTKGGLFIPETQTHSEDQRVVTGFLVSIGHEFYKDGTVKPCAFIPGMTVAIDRWEGDIIKEGGSEYRVVRIKDILAVIENG